MTTLELFFDLVFVFTITQLTVLLADDLSFAQVGRVPPENLVRRVILRAGMFGLLTCALAILKASPWTASRSAWPSCS